MLSTMFSHVVKSRPFPQRGLATDGVYFILRVSIKQVSYDEGSLFRILG
jgi:hypothetical protein